MAISRPTSSLRTRGGHASRAGLATLELVLSLPILLGIMALMVNFGSAASWKVRAAQVARDAVWNARWPRFGASPQPANWPLAAVEGVTGGGAVDPLYDSTIDQPVARGPQLGPAEVNRGLLDPTRGLRRGTSHITRVPPMLAKIGSIQFDLHSPLLNDSWQYQCMGMSANQQRRIPVIYDLPQASRQLVQAFINAAKAVYFASYQPQLAVLDRDDEIRAYYGSAADFHPRLSGFCSLDTEMVHERYVLKLVDRIQSKKDRPRVAGVPERMTRFFINMYTQQIRDLKAQLLTATPAQATTIQTQIDGFQAKIDLLKDYLKTL